MTYALDASAVLRYLDDEPGADRVTEIIKAHLSGRCTASISRDVKIKILPAK